MSALTKKARSELVETMRNLEGDIRRKLNRNKFLMREIVEKQTILKRKRAEITRVIKTLDGA